MTSASAPESAPGAARVGIVIGSDSDGPVMGAAPEALTEFGSLSEIPELQAICNALVQGRRRGTPVARTLRIESETLKKQRVFRAEAEAGKATVKLVIPMLVCFFLPMMVILLGPTLVQFGRVLGGGS